MMKEYDASFEGLDAFEALGVSLQSAVEDAFKLSQADATELEFSLPMAARTVLEQNLRDLKAQRQHGLRQQVAEKLCSGNLCDIEASIEIAQVHARNRVAAKSIAAAIRASIQADIERKNGLKRPGNSTMKNIRERRAR